MSKNGLIPGDHCCWDMNGGSGYGCGAMMIMYSEGIVPGVDGPQCTATAEDPAARIEVYEARGNGFVPSGKHIGKNLSALTKIATLPLPTKKLSGPLRSRGDVNATPESVAVRTVHKMTVHVDHPIGTKKSGTDPDGKPFEVTYTHDYGFFPSVPSHDGMDLDTYLGKKKSGTAYVIQQMKPRATDDTSAPVPDEQKVMLLFGSPKQAKEAYLAHVHASMYGGMKSLSVASLREQLAATKGTTSPFVIEGKDIDDMSEAAPAGDGDADDDNNGPESAPASSEKPGAAAAEQEKGATAMTEQEKNHGRGKDAGTGGNAAFPFLVARDAGGGAGEAGEEQDGLFVREFVVSRVRGVHKITPEERAAAAGKADDEKLDGYVGYLDIVASTAEVDSYGEVVEQKWDLGRFRKNPVFLWAHNSRMPPLGKATNVVVGTNLEMRVWFLEADANPMAPSIFRQYEVGALSGFSVGFVPQTVKHEKVDGEERYVLSDNMLYEISAVPIPANASALAKSAARQRSMAAQLYQRSLGGGPVEKGAVPYKAFEPVDDTEWDGAAAVEAWKKVCGIGGEDEDWTKFRQMFAWYDSANPKVLASYKLPHHKVEKGELKTSRAGVIAAAKAIQGARTDLKIPDGDMDAVKNHIGKHYKVFDMKPPWEDSKGAQQEEEMDPKEHERILSEERTKTVEQRTRGDELQQKLDLAVAEKAAAEARVTGIQKELDGAIGRAEKAETKLVEQEIGSLVGTKMYPHEKDATLAVYGLARASKDFGVDGKCPWAAHLKSIKDRPEIKLLGAPVIPADNGHTENAGTPGGPPGDAQPVQRKSNGVGPDVTSTGGEDFAALYPIPQ